MKVLDRHLFFSVLGPFLFTLIAFSSLMLTANLFSSLDDFIQHKAPLVLVLDYYRAFIPGMMTLVLPTTVLFSSLYSLLRLSKNAELTVIQACGVPLWRIYAPYIALAVLCTMGLYFITIVRGGNAKARQESVIAKIRGNLDTEYIKSGLVYEDRESGRVWYLQQLNLHFRSAVGVEVLTVNSEGRDETKYFAKRAEWKSGFWTLYDVRELHFAPDGKSSTEESVDFLPCPNWKENPLDMSVLQINPDQLTFIQLNEVTGRLNWQSEAVMAPYRTQLYYLWTYPLCILVLTLFALIDGTSHSRKNASAGVFNAIFVLIIFFLVLHTSLAMGRGDRLSPLMATTLPLLIFSLVGVLRIAPRFGWYPLNYLPWMRLT